MKTFSECFQYILPFFVLQQEKSNITKNYILLIPCLWLSYFALYILKPQRSNGKLQEKFIMKKNKMKGKWMIGIAVLAVVIVCIALSSAAGSGKATLVNYTELYPTELINSISIKGVVESAEKNNIYSNLGFPVKIVNVELGDTVTEGQILCVLNTEELENNIAQQRIQFNTLKKDLPLKKSTFEDNKELLDRGYISQNELSRSEITYINAVSTIETQLLAIEIMERQLSDSVIRAPASGAVTAVYAKAGRPGSGLLFVIEETDNLLIKTMIKEYDISKAKVGMKVDIKSDSTGNAIYEGVISKIAPAAVKDTNGETVLKSSDIEFEAQVKLVSRETDLRIGMNTRLNVILEKKDHVYCVPYDAIVTDLNGESSIYIASENGVKKQIAKQINVSTGIETDFYVEISGLDLLDGMKVVSDASTVRNGTQLNIGGSKRG